MKNKRSHGAKNRIALFEVSIYCIHSPGSDTRLSQTDLSPGRPAKNSGITKMALDQRIDNSLSKDQNSNRNKPFMGRLPQWGTHTEIPRVQNRIVRDLGACETCYQTQPGSYLESVQRIFIDLCKDCPSLQRLGLELFEKQESALLMRAYVTPE